MLHPILPGSHPADLGDGNGVVEKIVAVINIVIRHALLEVTHQYIGSNLTGLEHFLQACLTRQSNYVAGDEGIPLDAQIMAQLTVRKASNEGVGAPKCRAAANGRSAEAEHRDIQRASLFGEAEDFAMRAEALRRRLRSSVDSSELIRADRDRDIAG